VTGQPPDDLPPAARPRPGGGGQDAWLGYTLGELSQIARRAAVC
jgi:hypothetical protein